MIAQIPVMTVDQFDEFMRLSQNEDKLWEFVGGEIFEVPSNPTSSYISSRFNFHLFGFVEANALGFVTGEAGGYMVMGEDYAPDVAFVSKARQSELATTGYNPIPPDLVVEVVSPTDDEGALLIKVGNYLAANTVVWVACPPSQTVEVYASGKPVQKLGINDMLDGGDVLPGFKLPLKLIFKEKAETSSS